MKILTYSQTSVIERFCSQPNRFSTKKLRLRLWTYIRVTTKPKDAERTRMRHDAAYVGFFHTIFGVTELLYFFYCLISNFCKFFQNFLYCTAS